MIGLDFGRIENLAWLQLCQVTATALVVGLVARFAGRRRPHLAYLLWLVVIVKCVTPPTWHSPTGLLGWVIPEPSRAAPPLAAADQRLTPALLVVVPVIEPVNQVPNGKTVATAVAPTLTSPPDVPKLQSHAHLANSSPKVGPTTPRKPVTSLLLWVWLTGALVGLLVLASKRLILGFVLRRSRVSADLGQEAMLEKMSHRLNVNRKVRLMVSSRPLGPAAYGILRPKLILPAAVLAQKTSVELELVLAHELIHIRRSDPAIGLLQSIAQILWWFHPLIWWANCQASRQRERCCDEAVVAGLKCPPDLYAQCLLDLLKLKRQSSLSAAFPGMRTIEVTSNRLEHIMNKKNTLKTHTPVWCWLVAAAAALIVLPAQRWATGSPVSTLAKSGHYASESTDVIATTPQTNPSPTQNLDAGVKTAAQPSEGQPDNASPNDSALPVADRISLAVGTVTRGTIIRDVRGVGSLVAEQIKIVPAEIEGRIERILAFPGAPVKADTVLLELSNPELRQSVVDAEWQLKSAAAQLKRLSAQLAVDKLGQGAAVATLQSEIRQARTALESKRKLAEQKVISAEDVQSSETRLELLERRLKVEEQRQAITEESAQAQLQVQELEVERLRSALDYKRRQIAALQVRAGIDGVLQQLGDEAPINEGQTVKPGVILAKVVQPARLRVEINVPESQAVEIQAKQTATVDTRAGVVPAHVVGVKPVVQRETGTVTVYVALDGPPPKGTRPGTMVEGRIVVERLPDVLCLNSPVNAAAHARVPMFKVAPDGKSAVRVTVKLGRTSLDKVEVLDGLQEGDRVILSDTTAWDHAARIVLR
jgi:HlyD family secretion protein